ncbi:ABC transporter [Aureococcus anophagefferens]|nr:ABC transporter [Aureococcus anophagefferens]
MAAQMELDASDKPVVNIRNLTFAYETGGRKNINGLNCVIPPNAKVILVGANGAGKSTLLRILTGVIYLGLEHDERTASRTSAASGSGAAGFEGIEPFSMDIAARDMMKKWQAENLERRDELVRVLGINLDWRMHECSDGQRKKVRIMLKLLRPFRLCVIDEFAADLDIFSRKRFFDYLTRECAAAPSSPTPHIFDQADVWATHVAFMQLDKVLSPIHALATYAPYREILARTGADRAFCPMSSSCSRSSAPAAEKEADAGEERLATKKNSGYEAGRLARAIAIDDMDEHRKERRAAEKRAEAEEAQRVVA